MTKKRFNQQRRELLRRVYYLAPENKEQHTNFFKSLDRLPRPKFSKEYPSYDAMWEVLKPVRDLVGM